MRALPLIVAVLLSTGCVTRPRLDGPPAAAITAAPFGFEEPVRALAMDRRFFEAHANERTRRVVAAADGSIDILALSGGGAGGAYGAGILVGLSEAQARPKYEIVTGVSTGALIAPLAYLGSDYDDVLTEAYSGSASENLMQSRGIGALFGVAIYQGAPLRELVDNFITDDLLAAIAREYATGRLLLVATTNLDREEMVIWNMGAIAARGGPEAKQLFIDVLVASASVPGVFPPVMIEVYDNGQVFQEMHVDGGASAPFFVAPDIALATDYSPAALHGAHVYVISNSQLTGQARTTPYNTVAIAGRSFSAVMNHSTRALLAQTDAFARRNEMSFVFTSIPRDYPYEGSLAFDREEMSALFAYGRRCAAAGRIWVNTQQALSRAERGENGPVEGDTPCPLLPPAQ